MTDLLLTAAFGDYDRTRFLDRRVYPDGIDLRILKLEPSDIFYRMCNYQEFDVSEMSMGAHCYLLGSGESPFIGMPAFPSRAFRHSMVYYNIDSGIKKPLDLNGKRIAIREWGMTALVWILGILGEEYGVDLRSIDWVAIKKPRVPIQMPEGTHIRYMTPPQNLSDMLASGEVDAALIHQAPACFTAGSPKVKRMFPDYKTAEIEYYRRTGIHPIMHGVVMRKDLYQQAPWTLRSIYEGLLQARRQTLAALSDTQALASMIPMLPAFMEETVQIFGKNFWPYGIKENRNALEKLVLYAFQQGLTPRQLSVEELFGESVRDEA
jgi:4,5-dihydroxyphthalate decarboxylase